MKEGLVLVVLGLAITSIVIGFGFATADRTRYNNDFTRIFPPHVITDHKDALITHTIAKNPSGYLAYQGISGNGGVAVIIDINKRKNVFIKTNDPGHQIDILTKQVDGILCTDGFLMYSSKYQRIVYLYRYRNEYLVTDTSLNVVGVGKTIDTTSVAKIEVSEANGLLKMSKPPLVVNKLAFVDGKYLFVNSNLVAKNEAPETSTNNSVIDVYDILEGSYLFSFYIEHQGKDHLKSFKVIDNLLTAEFDHKVVIYKLAEHYLN